MSSTNNFEMLERSIKSALVEFDCTMSQLASYSDIKNSRFSRGLTQEHPFSPEEKTTIESVITAMRSLQDSTTPSVPIAWANIGKLKPFIDQRRKELREQGDPIVRRCILIRTSRTGFFLRINGTNVVTTPSEMTAAAFETPDIASGVCRELKKRGTVSQIETFGAFRRKSTMTHSLIEIGFEQPTTERTENGQITVQA